MNIDYTVTALMFPAIPLIMGVYSNRFHTLSNLIRKIHDEHVFEKHTPPEWRDQLKNLNNRINVYKNETLPVLNHYKNQNKYHSIDGHGTIENIFDSICSKIDN